MNKEQFKLQAQHNRYVRGAIASICKIILWTDIYVLFVWFILSIFASVEASTTAETLIKDSNSDNSGMIVVGSLILLCTVIYICVVVHEIFDKINQHKRIIALEDEYFGVAPKTSENTKKVDDDDDDDDEEDSDDDDEDDMI